MTTTADGRQGEEPGLAPMRAEVAASWERSAAAGVDVDEVVAPISLDTSDLRGQREAHPLARVFPLLDDVLGHEVRACGAVMALGDTDGNLLWVCGTSQTLQQAERIGFVEGSNWDERLAGTNAPGLTLSTGAPSLVTRDEHFRASVRQWSCAAAPIHDPRTQRLLGVLDVTGGDELLVPQTMGMVRAAARMAEAELARHLPPVPPPELPSNGVGLVLEALGRDEAIASIVDERGAVTRMRLSRRHSEILVLLSASEHGLTGDELADRLYEDPAGSSTMRAELNRLRGLLGDDLLSSRPYRLRARIAGDWLAVSAQVASGDLRSAMRGYDGPLLPRSTAPGIADLRAELEASLRQGVLRSGAADLMSAWTRSSWGRDDYDVWQAQQRVVPLTSPFRVLVDGQLARLDRELT